MAYQPAICSSCGGRLSVDDIDLNGFAECTYCHTPHKIIDIITIDGLPTAKTYLANANMALEDGNFDKATEFYKKILEIKPNCHEAFWGLYNCQRIVDQYYDYKDKYGNSGPFTKANIISATLKKYAYRAIETAPQSYKEQYLSAIESEQKFVDDVKSGKYDQVERDIQGKSQSGCYIATCVYGSYSCDEVVQLRKFRDETLEKSLMGRMFIRLYYSISPYLIRFIKKDSRLERTIILFLDFLRERLIHN